MTMSDALADVIDGMNVQIQRDNLTIPRGHEFGEIVMGEMGKLIVRVASETSPSKPHPISTPLDKCLHSKSSNCCCATKKDANPFTPKARVLLLL